ncbi:MAG TPA: universal stress protein [Usitatibacteraceae bacterium]|nr:universal stress protein [Usitatibacteraceae bacterium]
MKRILIPVDGSATGLLAVKAVLADRSGNVERIELLNVQPRLSRHASRYIPRRSRDGWREERAHKALEPARRLVESAGIACRTHTGIGVTAQVVADTARLLGVNEIVLGATQRGPVGRLLANSLSSRLLAAASVPVRVIAAAPAPAFERYAAPVGIGIALLAFAAQD